MGVDSNTHPSRMVVQGGCGGQVIRMALSSESSMTNHLHLSDYLNKHNVEFWFVQFVIILHNDPNYAM